MKAVSKFATVAVIAATLALGACGEPSKQELIDKSEDAASATELEQLLGKPDNISKMGPVETWTYEASDGSVKFTITGDTVMLTRTGGSSEEEAAE